MTRLLWHCSHRSPTIRRCRQRLESQKTTPRGKLPLESSCWEYEAHLWLDLLKPRPCILGMFILYHFVERGAKFWSRWIENRRGAPNRYTSILRTGQREAHATVRDLYFTSFDVGVPQECHRWHVCRLWGSTMQSVGRIQFSSTADIVFAFLAKNRPGDLGEKFKRSRRARVQ